MFRKHWRNPAFWRWWWRRRLSTGTKVVVATVAFAALLSGGWIASSGLPGANAGHGTSAYVLETTVSRIVTIRSHGKTVVKKVPIVISRAVVRSETSYQTIVDTKILTTPGAVKYVEKKVLRYVPVVRQRVVTVGGKTSTVTETRRVPTVKTQTLTNVVTNQQTVTNDRTVVVSNSSTVVQPVTTVETRTAVETRTVTSPPDTVTITQTVVRTETAPADTVTISVPTVTVNVLTVTVIVPTTD